MFGPSIDIPIVQITIPYTGSAKDVLKIGNILESLR
jgi:aromatic ring-opening dioxygenase catalytic subunit (LigB family)